MDIKRARRWKTLSANSKLMLSTIAGLNLFAFIVIWALEANTSANPIQHEPGGSSLVMPGSMPQYGAHPGLTVSIWPA